MRDLNVRHHKEVIAALRGGDYDLTDEGLLIKRSIRVYGRYYTTINGKDLQINDNLIPDEGILSCLNVWLGASAKSTAFYLAPFSGVNQPAADWTGANFPANANEITSLTEGFSNVTRPQWVPSAASGGEIDNFANRAVLNTVCTPGSPVSISGFGLIADDQNRGGVSGILVSAMRYDNVRSSNNGDSFEVGYKVGLTDS